MDSKVWIDTWARVRLGTMATIELFLEDELSFTPVAGSYSIREIALHIAHEEAIEILHGLARRLTELPEPYAPQSFPTKATIGVQLAEIHTEVEAYLRELTPGAFEEPVVLAWGEQLRPIDVVLHVIEHETHHRGELSLALGLLGRRGYDA